MDFALEALSAMPGGVATAALSAACAWTLAKRFYFHAERHVDGRWRVEWGFSRRPSPKQSLSLPRICRHPG